MQSVPPVVALARCDGATNAGWECRIDLLVTRPRIDPQDAGVHVDDVEIAVFFERHPRQAHDGYRSRARNDYRIGPVLQELSALPVVSEYVVDAVGRPHHESERVYVGGLLVDRDPSGLSRVGQGG